MTWLKRIYKSTFKVLDIPKGMWYYIGEQALERA